MIPHDRCYWAQTADAWVSDVHVAADVFRFIARRDLAADHPLVSEPLESFDDRIIDIVEDADDFIETDERELAEVVADQPFAFALIGVHFRRQVGRRIKFADADPFVLDFGMVNVRRLAHGRFSALRLTSSIPRRPTT